MALGSLIGFGLLFVAVSWILSAALSLWLVAARERVRRRGPWAERRAAVLVLLVPPMIAILVTTIIAGFSLIPSSDHCLDDADHLHLCLVHGAAWTAKSWALISVSMVAATVLVRLVARADSLLASRRLLSQVEAFSVPVGDTNSDVMLVPTERALCFTAGVRRPRIYVSRPIWDGLDADERAAMLAHERAHIAHGDTWRGSVLSALALLGAPLLAARVLELWGEASERLCDRTAADAVGSEADVASAIAVVSRLVVSAPAPCGFLTNGDDVEDRIHAVMNEQGNGSRIAARLSAVATATVVCVVVASVAFADPLHHALETLLGTL